MVDALTLGGQQLDEVGAAVGLGGSEDLRQVGAEGVTPGGGRIGQRSLLQQLAAVTGSPDADGFSSVAVGVCDPDHMVVLNVSAAA